MATLPPLRTTPTTIRPTPGGHPPSSAGSVTPEAPRVSSFSLHRGPVPAAPTGKADPAQSALQARTAAIVATLPRLELPQRPAPGFTAAEALSYQRIASDLGSAGPLIEWAQRMEDRNFTMGANDLQYVRGREQLERAFLAASQFESAAPDRQTKALAASVRCSGEVALTQLSLSYLAKALHEVGRGVRASYEADRLQTEIKGGHQRFLELEAAGSSSPARERPILAKAKRALEQALIGAETRVAIRAALREVEPLQLSLQQAIEFAADLGSEERLAQQAELAAKVEQGLEPFRASGAEREEVEAASQALRELLDFVEPVRAYRVALQSWIEANDSWRRLPSEPPRPEAPARPRQPALSDAAEDSVRAAQALIGEAPRTKENNDRAGLQRQIAEAGLALLAGPPPRFSVAETFGRDFLQCATKDLQYAVDDGLGKPLGSPERDRAERAAEVLLQTRAAEAELPSAEASPINDQLLRLESLLDTHARVVQLGAPFGRELERASAAAEATFARISETVHEAVFAAVEKGERDADAGKFLGETDMLLVRALPLYEKTGAVPEFYARMQDLKSRYFLKDLENTIKERSTMLAGLQETPPSPAALEASSWFLQEDPPDYQEIGRSLQPQLDAAVARAGALKAQIIEARRAVGASIPH